MTQQISKALIVDDSRLARIALSKLLGKRQIEVDVVGTGMEALEYLDDRQPDVVFMDYMMPDMDGFEATRRIRALPVNGATPVVMYTSQDSDEDRAAARELGIAGFLSKPSGEHSLDELLTRLNRQAVAANDTAATALPADTEQTREAAEVDSGAIQSSDQEPAPEIAPTPAVQPTAEPAFEDPPAEPAAAAGAKDTPPPPAQPTWQEIRDVARQAARSATFEALEETLPQALTPLRAEIEDARERTFSEAQRLATEAAGAKAEESAKHAAEAVADSTARAIANSVAEETAGRVAESLGPETARRVMSELREEIHRHVAEALPERRDAPDGEALAGLAERNAETAEAAAVEAIEERLAAFRGERDQLVQEAITRELGAVRGLVWGLAAAAIAVATVSLAVSLIVAIAG